MDLQILPAPIAYVRHLVDVEDDDRAKFDQLRVLAQNTLHFKAAILVNDCHRLQLAEQLPTPIPMKRLAVGDFSTMILEASDVLMPRIKESYVPELVCLYGDQSREATQRKIRLQRIVAGRNRDAHTASLAPTGSWLEELNSDLDDMLEELEFLRSYVVVAAKNVEITPDRRGSFLNGVRCHGLSDRYVPASLPIKQMVSRREVILVRSDRSDSLSLRPWLLYLPSDEGARGSIEELALLNSISERRLDHIGLISGAMYKPGNEWRAFTVYDTDASQRSIGPVTVSHELSTESHDLGVEGNDADAVEQFEDNVSVHLKQLDSSYESIVIELDRRAESTEYFVSVRTPSRDIAIATVDSSGKVWIYPRSLERAAENNLITQTRLYEVFGLLESAKTEDFTLEAALQEIGHISEQAEWLSILARSFAE